MGQKIVDNPIFFGYVMWDSFKAPLENREIDQLMNFIINEIGEVEI